MFDEPVSDGGVVEHAFTCPYCWETITMLLEPSTDLQSYIEDCEVCCNPIEVTFSVDADGVVTFNADRP